MDYFEQQKHQEDELFRHLVAAPLVEIVGIVDDDVVGNQHSGQVDWTMSFRFVAWRIEKEPLRHTALKILRRMNDRGVRRFQSKIASETIIRIRARIDQSDGLEVTDAYLEKIIALVDDDSELNARLAELQRPITLDDPDFGTFLFNRKFGLFTAAVTWMSQPIELELEPKDKDRNNVEACLEIARQLWAGMSIWQSRIQDFAVQELLPLKNDGWLEEDEGPCTADEFKNKMELHSITIYCDGHFSFWHSDGDMFWGHSIQIRANLIDGPYDADTPG